DQRTFAGELCDESCRGLGTLSSGILRLMPGCRANLGKEALHLRLIRDELAVEVAAVPLPQHVADIEDDGGDGHEASGIRAVSSCVGESSRVNGPSVQSKTQRIVCRG